MPVHSWMLSQYQAAAVEMCSRLSEDPFAPVHTVWDGEQAVPHWTIYARRMAEHALMVEVMRLWGHPSV